MAGRDAHGVELGNLRIVNVKTDIATITETDFSFSMPSGGVSELRETTYHLLRASVLAAAGEGGNFYTSEMIIIKKFEVMKAGSSQKTNLLSGTPNIKEVAGDGKLSKLMTVIETLENNESVTITIRNNDTVTVTVSFTLWIAVFPRARSIAAQGADSVVQS